MSGLSLKYDTNLIEKYFTREEFNSENIYSFERVTSCMQKGMKMMVLKKKKQT